uniref:Uncharacterized protein n=1 Tax=Candidatus Kentrum sp. LFY TaxID=2126342 RepID=A0A450U8N7_9GAMM|nr:MAG: hypothetical protein BECKLFY1418A_GA0070994_100411 [Candidatus Kentron sp. LFY]
MRGLEPRTLGVTDYDMDAPLKAIRRLMLESNGLITIALRRSLIMEARRSEQMPISMKYKSYGCEMCSLRVPIVKLNRLWLINLASRCLFCVRRA